MTNCSCIIAGGGSASRFGGGNKLLEVIDGVPVFIRSLRNMSVADQLILVIPAAERGRFEEALARFAPELTVKIACGGATRGESVRNGLALVQGDSEFVAVHDAARPLAGGELLLQLLGALTAEVDGVIPAKRVTDTIKEVGESGIIVATPRRDRLIAVETPQVFRTVALREAYHRCGAMEFTDDSAVMEMAGFKIRWLENAEPNLKITFQGDLKSAERHK